MTTLKLGSRGTEVTTLQLALYNQGYTSVIADGIFGAKTETAVKAFQTRNGLTADGIVGAKTWAALGYSTNPRDITEIIVHCSATPEGRDYTVDDIRKWHLARGFSDIGYHWVVYRDGSVHKGRDEGVTGAHCTNHNSKSIGVCYIGGMDSANKNPKDTRTEAQKRSLVSLLKELKARYPKATIHGHREFAAKACPSFDVKAEYRNL